MKGVTTMSLVATAHAPRAALPYEAPFCERISTRSTKRLRYTTAHSLAPIEQQFALLSTLESIMTSRSDESFARFGAVARLEFVHDSANDITGVLIFDSYERLIVHVVPVQLVYPNTRRDLAVSVAKMMGVPERMIAMAVDSAAQHRRDDHVVILSRQSHYTVNGEDRADPTELVSPDWDCWYTPLQNLWQ